MSIDDVAIDDPVRVYDLRTLSWEPFQHPRLPGGDMTPMVHQFDSCTMMAHFPPNFRADPHSHPGGGIYVIRHGGMDFGDGRVVTEGMMRIVEPGHVYGPEIADRDLGCTFLLVSREPIRIDFAYDPVDFAAVDGRPVGL